jgi:hypothetical protein
VSLMAIGSTPSTVQSAAQSGWQQFRVRQAQRDAEQAEQNALALQAKAADARRTASHAQENARSLEVQAGQASDQAAQARRGVMAVHNEGQTFAKLGAAYDKISQAVSGQVAVPAPVPATPVVNGRGEVTGQLVHVAA